jgi:septal ring factor EnvC (AmiA/AmiB activator)
VLYSREVGEIARQRRLAAVESEALFAADSARADARPEPQADDGLFDFVGRDAPMVPPTALLTPVSGALKQRFGETLASGGRANGLTYVTEPGAAVRSPDAGRVQYVGPVKGWGLIVILKLTGGYHLVLAGLDQTSAEVGQSVAAGAPVGFMPDRRQSTPELYFEVRDQGSPQDPARWLQGTG